MTDMIRGTSSFHLDEPAVIAEVFETEVVIVHLSKGVYYTLDAVGTLAWQCAMQGARFDDVVSAMSEAFPAARDRIEVDLRRLFTELRDQGIVVERASTGPAVAVPSQSIAYRPPTLEKKEDLSHLLALDPPSPDLILQADMASGRKPRP